MSRRIAIWSYVNMLPPRRERPTTSRVPRNGAGERRNTTTADFVKKVAISDLFEVESNKLPEQKGNAQEKSFAGQMVTDHTKTSTDLKGLVSYSKVKAEVPKAIEQADKRASRKGFSSDFASY